MDRLYAFPPYRPQNPLERVRQQHQSPSDAQSVSGGCPQPAPASQQPARRDQTQVEQTPDIGIRKSCPSKVRRNVVARRGQSPQSLILCLASQDVAVPDHHPLERAESAHVGVGRDGFCRLASSRTVVSEEYSVPAFCLTRSACGNRSGSSWRTRPERIGKQWIEQRRNVEDQMR